MNPLRTVDRWHEFACGIWSLYGWTLSMRRGGWPCYMLATKPEVPDAD